MGFHSLHGGSPWNVWNLAMFPGMRQKMLRHWALFSKLWTSFEQLATAAIDSGHYIAVEWPRDCEYWSSPEVLDFLDRHELTSVIFDGCAFGLQSVVDQRPIRKPWRVATNSQELVTILMPKQCGRMSLGQGS